MMAWLAVALAAPPTLCEGGETARFQCGVAGGKVAALCETEAGAVYRFGAPGAVELQVPKAGYTTALEAGHRSTGEDAATSVFSLWNEGHRYALVAERTEDQFEGRVVVRKGAKVLATLACTGPVAADTTGLPGRFVGDAKAVTSWVGQWEGPDGGMVLSDVDGALVVEGQALWHGGGGRVHDGQIAGALAAHDGGWRYAGDGCEVTLKRTSPDVLEASDNLKCGGLNVSFAGTYHRAP